MANVVLTRNRRDMIVSGSIKHLDAEYNELNKRIDSAAMTLASFVYDMLVPADLQAKLAAIPSDYLYWAKGVRICFSDGVQNHITDVQFGMNRPLCTTKMSGIAKRFEPKERDNHSAIATVFDLMAEQNRVMKERAELKEKLEQLMAPCTSLQQLCKVFPTALNLVDEDTRKMYNRRVERGESPDLTQLMTPDLKVALVKSTMVRQAKG
jgi:hypothetical protein